MYNGERESVVVPACNAVKTLLKTYREAVAQRLVDGNRDRRSQLPDPIFRRSLEHLFLPQPEIQFGCLGISLRYRLASWKIKKWKLLNPKNRNLLEQHNEAFD